MTEFQFSQVDVFSSEPVKGNPVAVVHGADSLADEQMAQFARWTNLSETTFLLEPADPDADYRVRISLLVGNCRLPVIPLWGRAMPGWRRAAGLRGRTW